MSTANGGQQQVSRPLQILLGVVVVLGLLYALWTFVVSPLLAGDDDAPDTIAEQTLAPDDSGAGDLPDPDGVTPPVDADADGSLDALTGEPVPETFEIFAARDPFQQLVVEAGEEGAGTVVAAEDGDDDDADAEATEAPTPGTSGSSSGTTAPEDNADDIDDDAGPTGGPSSGDEGDPINAQDQQPAGPREVYQPNADTVGTTAVTLSAVQTSPTEQVTVAIDDAPYDVAEGEVFAERFQLLDIDGRCATFLYGDSRFVLCEGETIMK